MFNSALVNLFNLSFQLEEAEQSRAAAVKIKQNKEKELSDLQQQVKQKLNYDNICHTFPT